MFFVILFGYHNTLKLTLVSNVKKSLSNQQYNLYSAVCVDNANNIEFIHTAIHLLSHIHLLCRYIHNECDILPKNQDAET